MTLIRPFIGIMGCHKDIQDADEQRNTWLLNCPIDYRFFMGRPLFDPKSDEVSLDVDDGYAFLPFKTQAICRWALEHGYTHLFKCDTDTYVVPERLLACGFEQWDYSGFFRGRPDDLPVDHVSKDYCSGGCGYWLSERAMRIVTASQMEENRTSETGHYIHGEDLQVGRLMCINEIPHHWDDRYKLIPTGPARNNDYITLSNAVRPLRNGRMIRMHREWQKDGQ